MKQSLYLCDSCKYRRNKDNPETDGFKCNTEKRRRAHYKGCSDFLSQLLKSQEKPKPKKKVGTKNG